MTVFPPRRQRDCRHCTKLAWLVSIALLRDLRTAVVARVRSKPGCWDPLASLAGLNNGSLRSLA
jgi:hypothetical protein